MTKSKRKPSATSPELMKAFDVIAKLKPGKKRKAKDPLAALKKKYPPPWKAFSEGSVHFILSADKRTELVRWKGFDGNGLTYQENKALVRAIARMGNEK
jgi:hypothetical protein